MRKVLSTTLLALACLFCKSQVILNEIYTNPGTNKHEFFELYNTSSQDINLDCYTLITLFEQNNKLGLYVIDLPKLSVKSKSFIVGAAAKTFNIQQKAGKIADFTWNDFNDVTPTTSKGTGSLKAYIVNEAMNGYETPFTPSTEFNNLFPELQNAAAGGVVYGVFLFNKDIYVNGLLTSYNKTTVPNLITSLPLLSITSNSVCSNYTINWQNVKVAENVTESVGSDNGFARTNDGICGTWVKTANGDNHTPGTSTNNLSISSGTLLTTTESYSCGPSIQFKVISSSNAAVFPVNVHVYIDNTVSGVLDINDIHVDPSQLIKSGDNSSHSYNVPGSQKPYLLVYETALGCLDKIVSLSCAVLPVHFKSFNAARNQQRKEQVLLKWETGMEQNCRGFYVQRKVNGQWKNIAFVYSQTENGNSDTNLIYEYKEINTTNSVSQYQIQQVDIDGKTNYSEVKTVTGVDQLNDVSIYPNPALNGKVNLLFNEPGRVKDIFVCDMNGRVIKLFREIRDNSLVVEGLLSGFYTIKVIDRLSSKITLEKVVIKK